MPASLETVGVLLAAGGSSRLGQPKQLLCWRGRPLIVHSILQLLEAGCRKQIVLLGAEATLCRQICDKYLAEWPELEDSILWVTNTRWQDGQATSLHLAIETLLKRGLSSRQVLIALCDQPLMQSQQYRDLIEAGARRQSKVAATAYKEGGGVPACIRADCLGELLTSTGDSGAKAWIRRQSPDDVTLLDFGEATRDIDTVEAWLEFQRECPIRSIYSSSVAVHARKRI